jgi:hypothetical protein
MELELRFLPATEVRVIPAADNQPAKLAGYAAVFNSPSEDLGGFREIIQPGSFRDHLTSGEDVRALMSHDADKLLGRTSSGTLVLSEDTHGLSFTNTLPDTSYARDLMALAARGDIRGMSFGFRVAKGGDSWAKDSTGKAVRTLTAVKLGEISYVASPAYPATAFSQRDLKVDPEALAAIFGNWSDLVIAMWGMLDVLVDPYTGSSAGTVRVVALQSADINLRHDESFQIMTDIVA